MMVVKTFHIIHFYEGMMFINSYGIYLKKPSIMFNVLNTLDSS